jgi:hypothetical protein
LQAVRESLCTTKFFALRELGNSYARRVFRAVGDQSR